MTRVKKFAKGEGKQVILRGKIVEINEYSTASGIVKYAKVVSPNYFGEKDLWFDYIANPIERAYEKKGLSMPVEGDEISIQGELFEYPTVNPKTGISYVNYRLSHVKKVKLLQRNFDIEVE